MRSDVQTIFMQSPCTKQVLMFSATLSKELKTVCRRFMSDVNILFSQFALWTIESGQVFYFNVHEIRLEATTVLCCSASMILHKETFTEVLWWTFWQEICIRLYDSGFACRPTSFFLSSFIYRSKFNQYRAFHDKIVDDINNWRWNIVMK